MQNGQNNCSQCRKACRKDQIIKLYFSESELEYNLISEMEEANKKIQKEANESKALVKTIIISIEIRAVSISIYRDTEITEQT